MCYVYIDIDIDIDIDTYILYIYTLYIGMYKVVNHDKPHHKPQS